MMTPEQRAQSRAICDAATDGDTWVTNHPGKWYVEAVDIGYKVYADDGDGRIEICHVNYEENGAFVARARTALPAALDAFDSETKRADEAEARAEALDRAIPHECNTCIQTHGGAQCSISSRCCGNDGRYNSRWQFDTDRFTPHDKTERTC